jgi:type II secretory pathway component HofQ
MDFQDASLVDVLKIFSQQTNLNLITAQSVADRKVTVYLDQVPIEQALEQILKANELTYEIQPGSNIYIVKPLQRPNSEMATRVYPLKHASVSSSKIRTLLNIEGGGGPAAHPMKESLRRLNPC